MLLPGCLIQLALAVAMFSTSLIMIPYSQNGHFVRFAFRVECEYQTKLFVDSDGPLVAVHLFVVKTLPISQRSLVRCCPNYDQFLSQRVDYRYRQPRLCRTVRLYECRCLVPKLDFHAASSAESQCNLLKAR